MFICFLQNFYWQGLKYVDLSWLNDWLLLGSRMLVYFCRTVKQLTEILWWCCVGVIYTTPPNMYWVIFADIVSSRVSSSGWWAVHLWEAAPVAISFTGQTLGFLSLFSFLINLLFLCGWPALPGKILLGGRAAEEVIYGRDTSRASVNYLADATWLARKIITM